MPISQEKELTQSVKTTFTSFSNWAALWIAAQKPKPPTIWKCTSLQEFLGIQLTSVYCASSYLQYLFHFHSLWGSFSGDVSSKVMLELVFQVGLIFGESGYNSDRKYKMYPEYFWVLHLLQNCKWSMYYFK